MKAKNCTCKDGKKNPKCPICSKSDVNLDSFHKLNPEAKPKTAEQFKIALALPHNLAQRAGQIGMAGLRSALPGAMVGAAVGGLTADEGQGLSGALSGAAKGGLVTGGIGAAHHGMMTGVSNPAQTYQNLWPTPKDKYNAGIESLVHSDRAHPNGEYAQAEQARLRAKLVGDRAQNMAYIGQRKANTPPPAPAPVEAPKAAMFYEFGKIAAIVAFAI